MTPQDLIEQVSLQSDSLRNLIQQQRSVLADFGRRLGQIVQQLRKNIEVRDKDFAEQFNLFVQNLRDTLNKREPAWTELRNEIRQVPDRQWTGDLALGAKGLNSRAKTLSRACDEFVSEYDSFCKNYKTFTAAKLNVWLLTSCQTDISNLTGKIVFIAREISRKTDQHRRPHAE